MMFRSLAECLRREKVKAVSCVLMVYLYANKPLLFAILGGGQQSGSQVIHKLVPIRFFNFFLSNGT